MYLMPNFKSKTAARKAIAAGNTVTIVQVGPYGGNEPTDGQVVIEGPHYPEPHRFYGTATLKDGVVIKLK